MRPDALASSRLTFAGFVAMGSGVAAAQWLDGASAWLIALPLAVLSLNLAAALCVHPRLRRGGLGLFHGCLLACMLLLAWGRLTHFDGRIAIADGQEFDATAVEVDARGPWHENALHSIAFRQGAFTVDYAVGVRRSHTRSTVELPDAAGGRSEVVGDDTPLKLAGYRFYTTHNKGFAPVLTWTARDAAPITGAVMLPAYPVNDWQQVQRWTAPGGGQWQLALKVKPVDDGVAWTLAPAHTDSVLVAEIAGRRFELRPGGEARTDAGVLRYEWLGGWMGYRIFHDPTLLPLLWLSILGVLGFAWHLWARHLRQQPVQQGVLA